MERGRTRGWRENGRTGGESANGQGRSEWRENGGRTARPRSQRPTRPRSASMHCTRPAGYRRRRCRVSAPRSGGGIGARVRVTAARRHSAALRDSVTRRDSSAHRDLAARRDVAARRESAVRAVGGGSRRLRKIAQEATLPAPLRHPPLRRVSALAPSCPAHFF